MMKRGEIWWVNFDPSIGGEIKKTRPAVIISNDIANKVMNRVQVVPVTSNVGKCYPCEAFIKVKSEPGKAMADQIYTVSKVRFKKRIGKVTAQEMLAVEQAVKLQLQLI